MIRILAVNAAVSGVISWAAAQLMYVFITFNRNYASSSYPGDLTAAQEWMYLVVSGMLLFGMQAAVAIIFKRWLTAERLKNVPAVIGVVSTAWYVYAVYGYLI
jgi:uncharacterized membrane protein YcjF (UPF0283 family)